MGEALVRDSLICENYAFKKAVLDAAAKMGGVKTFASGYSGGIKITTNQGKIIIIQPGAGCAFVED